MPIYWSLKSIPELATVPRAERDRAWRRAYGKTFRHWETWVALLACGACAALGGYVGGQLGSVIIGAAVGGGIGGFLFRQIAIGVARRHYVHLLAGN